MEGILLKEIIEKFDLENLTPDIDISNRRAMIPEISRPSLFIAGYFEDFAYERVQIMGGVEHNYFATLSTERQNEISEKMLSYNIPCIIMCRGLKPGHNMIDIATKKGVPIFGTADSTSMFTAELNRWLIQKLAKREAMHGVLVEVYGIGVLITGESGIGKSEAALELIRRGHRLVSDDIVEIHKVNGDLLVGESPEITRHFLELRGIGIIDIKMLYGVEAVKPRKTIELIINLEEWDKNKQYDRVGNKQVYTTIMGIDIETHNVPIRPGRNLAVIVETAAVNYRQHKMGYNAADELYRRIDKNMLNK